MVHIHLDGEVKLAQENPPPPVTSPSDSDKDAREGRVAVATTLATGVTVLVATLGVFGGLTGAVARMARNYPVLTGIALAAVIVSVALGVSARLIGPKGDHPVTFLPRTPHRTTALLALSTFLLAAGLILSAVLMTLTIGKDDRPSVTAQSTRSDTGISSLAGTAKAGGLAADDAIRVVVVSFAEGQTETGTQLYYAVVGPNPDGVVEHSFTVILPQDARSVVITAGNDVASSTDSTPSACAPAANVTEPVDPAEPVVVTSGDDDMLTACALVVVPSPAL